MMEKNAPICMEDYSYKGQLLHAAKESQVFKAINKHNPSFSPYIFKGYPEQYLTDPIREAKLMRELNSLWKLHGKQNILQIVSQHSRDGRVFLILQFCEGGDLQQQIKKEGKFSQQKSIACIQQIIKGYSSIYEAALIHRNLEPSSILSTAFQLKIGDFSECIKQSEAHLAETRQEFVGNLHYHPYQVLQNYEYSVKSDIYSIGAILFCMLTGRPPFEGPNRSEITKQMQSSNHKNVINSLKNKKLSQFLLKTLERDASWRMSVQQLIEFDFQLMPQLNKLKLNTFDDKDSILVEQSIHAKKPALQNIRETSREKQLEESMKTLFMNFEASENKGDLTQHKLSMVDLRVSDQGELSRLYKDREISIFIPTKLDLPQQQESQLDNLGLQQIESIEKRPSEGLPLKKRAGTNREISNRTCSDLLKSQIFSKKKVIQTAKNLKIEQTQAQLKETKVVSQKMHQSKAPSIKEETIIVSPLQFSAEKTSNRMPQDSSYRPKTTERSYFKGPFTLRGREKVVDEVGRMQAKSSNIAGWLISQIDMFRFLNRVIFKIKREGRNELDSLSSSLGRLKSQILKDVRELTHLSRQQRAYFQNSSQYDKIVQIILIYESKMSQVNGQFQGYQKLNTTVLSSIDLIFKSISRSTQFRQSQVKLLDYLITLWQLLKLLKRNNPEYFHSKSKILEIIDAKEVKLTIAHLLHIYQRMKALKLI